MRRHALPLLLLLAAVSIAFWDVLPADRGLVFRDHLLVFKPRWWAIIESFKALEIPALTRATTAGVPIEQLLNGTYTPLALLFLFGDFDVAYDWFVIGHFMLLAGGAYLLALRLGADRTESFLAAGILTLAGPVVSFESLVVNLIGLSYLPGVLWALHRLLGTPTPLNIGLLSLLAGFFVQGAIPEVTLLALIGAAALLIRVRPRPSLRLLLAIASAGLLAIAVAAIQIGPVAEVLGRTQRGHGFDYGMSSGWALNPLQWVDLIAPSFWAPPAIPFLNPALVTGDAAVPQLPVPRQRIDLRLRRALIALPQCPNTSIRRSLLLLFSLGRDGPAHAASSLGERATAPRPESLCDQVPDPFGGCAGGAGADRASRERGSRAPSLLAGCDARAPCGVFLVRSRDAGGRRVSDDGLST